MARAACDGVHRRNQHSFTMARSALLLTSFIITLDSMIYRITNFHWQGGKIHPSSPPPATCCREDEFGSRAARRPSLWSLILHRSCTSLRFRVFWPSESEYKQLDVYELKYTFPRRVTGQYLRRGVRTLDPLSPRGRFLKFTKTEELASLNGKKGAEACFRSRVGGRVYVKCTGWSGVGCEWAEIKKKQNPTSVDRSRPRGHLGCKGGCLEYKRELLGARKWPGSGDA